MARFGFEHCPSCGRLNLEGQSLSRFMGCPCRKRCVTCEHYGDTHHADGTCSYVHCPCKAFTPPASKEN